MFFSCHIRVWSESTLLPEFQGVPCSKQVRYLNVIDCNGTLTHNHLVRKRTLDHLVKLAFSLASLAK